MKRAYLFCFFVGLSQTAFGDLDLSFNVQGRTYPEAASSTATVGYGQYLYGKKASKGEEIVIDYGYIRPLASLTSMGSFNKGAVAFDFYPISILGLQVGSAAFRNAQDNVGYNCERIACQGSYSSQFWKVQATAGFGKVFGIYQTGQDFIYQNEVNKFSQTLFLEGESGLGLRRGNDSMTHHRIFLGYEQNKKISVYAVYGTAESQSAKQWTQSRVLMGQYNYNSGNLILGVGDYVSDLRDQSVSIFARYEWTVFSSLELN